MTYTEKPNHITFEIPSDYTRKPLNFTIRRKNPLTRFELKQLEKEVSFLESWAWGQEGHFTSAFRAAYNAFARGTFTRILKGEMHALCLEQRTWRVARNLNDRGENDYRVTRRTYTGYRKWL